MNENAQSLKEGFQVTKPSFLVYTPNRTHPKNNTKKLQNLEQHLVISLLILVILYVFYMYTKYI